MEPRFEVVKTLLIDKQTKKVKQLKDGTRKVEFHSKPVGYVFKDLKTGKLLAVSHLNACELAVKYGVMNVIVSQTYYKDNRTGKRMASPYIRANAGNTSLQDSSMVMQLDFNALNNMDVIITREFVEDLKYELRSRKR